MVAVTTRAGKGSPLTNAEIDANWNALVADLNTKMTQAQARAAISVSGSLTYDSATGILGFTETPLTSANIVTALGFTPLSNAGGTLSGGLTVTGNLLLAANSGGNRIVGFSGGTNTTLVLQAGGASGAGANIELTADAYAYLDATETRIRSLDGATAFLSVNSTATNVVTGALRQNGNQVLHAANVSTYALPIGGGTLTGNLVMSGAAEIRSSRPGNDARNTGFKMSDGQDLGEMDRNNQYYDDRASNCNGYVPNGNCNGTALWTPPNGNWWEWHSSIGRGAWENNGSYDGGGGTTYSYNPVSVGFVYDAYYLHTDEIGGGEYHRNYRNCNCGAFNCRTNCNCNCNCNCACK